jgi:lipid A 3-O-deacylase
VKVRLTALAAGAIILSGFGQAGASPFDEVRGGVFAHGVGPFTAHKEDGASVNGEILFKSPQALSFMGSPRPVIGATIATEDGATSQVYAGLAWRRSFLGRLFIEGGGGFAIHNGETHYSPSDPDINGTTYFGCRVLFRVSGDLGFMLTDRLSVSAHSEHISNAGICSENEGLDNSGIRFGYRL